jgi:hypothetical protein
LTDGDDAVRRDEELVQRLAEGCRATPGDELSRLLALSRDEIRAEPATET